jgi:uncharacterized protein (DUF1778 family)|tara:strand:+ start:270 stop:569 length:300 start_codon:yes stop_codon:yes gene_type:complete
MSYKTPNQITITTPNKMPIGFGPNSTGNRGGNLRVRCTDKEYDAIKLEAELLNITLATFTRWCAVHAAQTLLEYRTAHMISDSIGVENEYDKFTKGTRK